MTDAQDKLLHIIGGGLAGSEAAWQAANAGARVILHEMRPARMTDAHKTDHLAELVCSNSFRSDDAENNAVGLLHAEMRRANSLIMAAADAHRVPAGSALAVDREGFAAEVSRRLEEHPNITIVREEIDGWPPEAWRQVIIATGPLTSEALARAILERTGEEALAFFDAIAPIVHFDSIDMDVCWKQSRYDKGGADYINCPLNREQYEAFIDALLAAEKTEFRDWERNTPYFDGCLPIEVMAERGRDTLRHGPMKPVGLTNPHTGERPYAVVQLRQDNALGTLFNMVGFQTKLKYGEQTRIFRMIPGLENAQFARLGGIHRNTFLNSPKLLDEQLRLKTLIEDTAAHRPASTTNHLPTLSGGWAGARGGGRCASAQESGGRVGARAPQVVRFAGQMTGVEGYVESAACGLMAGRAAAAELLGQPFAPPPPTTAHGALIHHITGGHLLDTGLKSFQPMNINFGLFPPVEAPMRDEQGRRLKGKERTKAKRRAITRRALADFEAWLARFS